MTVDYNPSDKWLKTVMKANEKNCQITSEKVPTLFKKLHGKH